MTWLDELQLSTVIIHTKHNGPSYRAVVEAVYDDGILLRDVANLDMDPITVDAGSSLIPREEVHRVQLLGDV